MVSKYLRWFGLILTLFALGCGDAGAVDTSASTGGGGSGTGSGNETAEECPEIGASCTVEGASCGGNKCHCGGWLHKADSKLACDSSGPGGNTTASSSSSASSGSGGAGSGSSSAGNGGGSSVSTGNGGAGGSGGASSSASSSSSSSSSSVASSSSSSASSSSSSASSGGGMVCSPGSSAMCTCTGNLSGTKTCDAFGAGYGSCNCPTADTVELAVVFVPITGGVHTIYAFCHEDDAQKTPHDLQVAGTRLTLTANVKLGTNLLCSLAVDPAAGSTPNGNNGFWDRQLCNPANFTQRLANISATVKQGSNAPQYTAKIDAESNGQQGCQLRIVAAPSSKINIIAGDPLHSDADGDGVTPAQGDCNDNDGSIAPWQRETPDDNQDKDCNGFANPAHAFYWLKVPQFNGVSSVTMIDAQTSKTYNMPWSLDNGGGYKSAPLDMLTAPREYLREWPRPANNTWPYCDANKCWDMTTYPSCQSVSGSNLITKDTDGTQIGVSQQGTSPCHLLASDTQLVP